MTQAICKACHADIESRNTARGPAYFEPDARDPRDPSIKSVIGAYVPLGRLMLEIIPDYGGADPTEGTISEKQARGFSVMFDLHSARCPAVKRPDPMLSRTKDITGKRRRPGLKDDV